VDLRAFRKHRLEFLDHPRGDGRAGGDDALECGELDIVGRAPLADPIEERRRAEEVGDRVMLDRDDDVARIDLAGAGEIHFGDDGGHAQGRAEEAEEWESRQIALAGWMW